MQKLPPERSDSGEAKETDQNSDHVNAERFYSLTKKLLLVSREELKSVEEKYRSEKPKLK